MARKKFDVSAYAAADLECAQIILSDPERYGGDGSLMVTWAQAIERKLCPTTEPESEEQQQRKLGL